MNKLEPLWYEISPYVYVLAGIVAIFQLDGIAKFFGIILLIAAATVVGMRKSYRDIQERSKKPKIFSR